MSQENTAGSEAARDWPDISDGGERVSHLFRDAVYYAHLSIYAFAAPFSREALVLDAGCGAGYGTAHLADAGARYVWGIDASEKAVEFSRHHFRRPNLSFQTMALERIEGFPPAHFDFIYSSNTLEHVPDVAAFLAATRRLLKPGGRLLVAVPPITDDRLQYLNLINPYHVNLWTPRQWAHVLGLHYAVITPIMHGVEQVGADFKPEHLAPGATLTEKSFVFAPATVDEMYRRFTLTAIFVAERPRPDREAPLPGEPPDFVDESFTRPPGHIPPEWRARLNAYFEMQSPPLTVWADLPTAKPTHGWRVANVLTSLRRRLSRR